MCVCVFVRLYINCDAAFSLVISAQFNVAVGKDLPTADQRRRTSLQRVRVTALSELAIVTSQKMCQHVLVAAGPRQGTERVGHRDITKSVSAYFSFSGCASRL